MWNETKLPYLDVSLLLDRTGSMANNWPETIMAVNSYIRKMLNDPEIAARAKITVFDRNGPAPNIDVIRPWVSASGWTDLRVDETPPRGNTPLYEAIGRTLTELRNEPRKEGIRVQYVVMTDGDENCSGRDWPHDRVRQIVRECDAMKNWSVVFLGADIDAVKVGMSLGTQYGSTMTYNKRFSGSTMDSLSRNTTAFAATGAGQAFSDSDRAQAMSGDDKPKGAV